MNGKDLLHCVKYYLGIEKSITQTSANEQNALIKYVKNTILIVEIGVFEGFNTKQFAIHSPDKAIIYAIDPFLKGVFGFSYGKAIAEKEWAKAGIVHKVKIIEGLSWDVVDQLPERIEFLFVDGDHSYSGVLRDFNLYGPKVAIGGVIAFHDARLFDRGWTREDWGPVRFVKETLPDDLNWEVVEEVDSLVFVKKLR